MQWQTLWVQEFITEQDSAGARILQKFFIILNRHCYKDTSGQDKRSDAVSTSKQFKTFFEEVGKAPDSDFVLLFFNGKIKPILKGWDGDTVKNELLKKSGAIDDILEKYKNVSRFTFYEDDVYYCVKKDKRSLGATFKDYVFKGEIADGRK